jgi:adenylate cyclase
MATEIERKFLVRGRSWRRTDAVEYAQGYLNRDHERTVRVRVAGDRAWLTIKGRSVGASRPEFEYEIPLVDAEQLLALSDGPVVRKRRHLVPHAGFTWEVDEFLGDNEGLVVAEIELDAEDRAFEKPDWVGEEVTGDPRYFNSSLATDPYRIWKAPGRGGAR